MTIRRQVGDLGTNAYIHSWETGEAHTSAILIDPGDSGFALARLILGKAWIPRAIVLSHGHYDHTAGLADALTAFQAAGFTVPIAIHGADARYLGPEGKKTTIELLSALGDLDWIPPGLERLPSPDILLSDGDQIADSGLRVIHTPGHSPGSICLHAPGGALAYTGDTLFFRGIGRADLPDSSPADLARSLSRLLDILPPDCVCWPGHGGETRAAAERTLLFPS